MPREVDTDEEEFVLKVESESGEIVGGCIAEAYEYHWSRMFLNILWVDERYRHHGIGSMIIRELERIAKENACRVVRREIVEKLSASARLPRAGFRRTYSSFCHKKEDLFRSSFSRRRRDLNPRAGHPTYTLSRGASSAS